MNEEGRDKVGADGRSTPEGSPRQDTLGELQTEKGFSKSLVSVLRGLEDKPKKEVAEAICRSVIGRDDVAMILQIGVEGANPMEVRDRLYELALELDPDLREGLKSP